MSAGTEKQMELDNFKELENLKSHINFKESFLSLEHCSLELEITIFHVHYKTQTDRISRICPVCEKLLKYDSPQMIPSVKKIMEPVMQYFKYYVICYDRWKAVLRSQLAILQPS